MATPDTTVQLGDFEFKDFEVPERIPFGGSQALVVHRMIGGTRIVDAMGREDAPISWSGLMTGSDADDRSDELDAIRVAGQPVSLTWGSKSYTVVVQTASFDYQRFYQIGYSISCVVVEDNSDAYSSDDTDTDSVIASDISDATDLADSIGDSDLSDLVSTVSDAIDEIDGVINATTSQLTAISDACTVATDKISEMIDTDETTINGFSTYVGVTTGSTYGTATTNMETLTDAINQETSLLSLQSSLNRISTNVSADNVRGATVRTAGGTLYKLATDAYGDVSGWTTIAQQNGISDPVLTGVNSLHVPATNNDTDGVLIP